jgi:hypothetical protein
LTKRFPLFLTFDVLRDRLTHQPVGCALASSCQALDAEFGVLVDLDRYRSNDSNSHDRPRFGSHWQYLNTPLSIPQRKPMYADLDAATQTRVAQALGEALG